jgi:16S rRNA (cytidine1402-2'-O)-methyltransferase
MLYVVPTPIGNLEDITLRALRILKEADLILAEDTRTSGILLKHYQISRPLQSYHAHNEHQTLNRWTERLQKGEKIALVSDAGTPSISDPGFLLVRACVAKGIPVECLPGPTAFVPALVKSGLPSDSFVFEGFLPQKKGRKTMLEKLAAEERTIILYESPYRVIKTLQQLTAYMGADRRVSVSRELTKLFEETINGSLEEVLTHFQTHEPKGEFVLIISGNNGEWLQEW